MIEVEVTGVGSLKSRIQAIVLAAETARGITDDWKDDFEDIERRRFAAQGPGWKPRKVPKASPIEVISGDLRNSLTDSAAPGAIRRPIERGIELGSSIPYAGYQQHGTRRMVARRLIDITKVDTTRWARLAADRLMGRVR